MSACNATLGGVDAGKVPRPYVGASILLVLLACLIPVYMGSPASIDTPVADAVDEPSNMGVMVESVAALPLELSTGPAIDSGGGAEYAIEEDPLQPIYRKVAGDMYMCMFRTMPGGLGGRAMRMPWDAFRPPSPRAAPPPRPVRR